MKKQVRNSLDRAIVRPREDSPYTVLKGKKIFKYHVRNRSRNWLASVCRVFRWFVDVHH